MSTEAYRYAFPPTVPLEEVEASLVLALFAAESVHGESQTRLDAAHHFDLEGRACVIDAGTAVGKDLNRLFVGFLQREFGADSFQVERVEKEADPREPAAVAVAASAHSPQGGGASEAGQERP